MKLELFLLPFPPYYVTEHTERASNFSFAKLNPHLSLSCYPGGRKTTQGRNSLWGLLAWEGEQKGSVMELEAQVKEKDIKETFCIPLGLQTGFVLLGGSLARPRLGIVTLPSCQVWQFSVPCHASRGAFPPLGPLARCWMGNKLLHLKSPSLHFEFISRPLEGSTWASSNTGPSTLDSFICVSRHALWFSYWGKMTYKCRYGQSFYRGAEGRTQLVTLRAAD